MKEQMLSVLKRAETGAKCVALSLDSLKILYDDTRTEKEDLEHIKHNLEEIAKLLVVEMGDVAKEMKKISKMTSDSSIQQPKTYGALPHDSIDF